MEKEKGVLGLNKHLFFGIECEECFISFLTVEIRKSYKIAKL
jgi:hypothetical protein